MAEKRQKNARICPKISNYLLSQCLANIDPFWCFPFLSFFRIMKFLIWIPGKIEQKIRFIDQLYTVQCAKGQLNSEWIYEVIVSPKMQTKNYKNFCPTKQTRIIALFFGDFLVSVGSFLAIILVCLERQKSL